MTLLDALFYRLRTALWFCVGFPGLRYSDVLLVSYPRSGSTWMRFILCNYVGIKEADFETVDFHVLDNVMPAIGASNLLRAWQYDSIPRFIKTHHHRSFLYRKPRRIVYLMRDPRDVMVSYYHFLSKHRWYSKNLAFTDFIRNREYGLASWFRHFKSWQSEATTFLEYEQMRKNPFDELSRMFKFLDVSVDNPALHLAIDRSGMNSVKKLQEKHGISGPSRFEESFNFARKGHSRQWASFFSEQDLAFYQELCRKYEYEYGITDP